MLAAHGVEARVRQAQLRHTDPRLTETTYFGKSLFVKPHAEKLAQAAAIKVKYPVAPGQMRPPMLNGAQN